LIYISLDQDVNSDIEYENLKSSIYNVNETDDEVINKVPVSIKESKDIKSLFKEELNKYADLFNINKESYIVKTEYSYNDIKQETKNQVVKEEDSIIMKELKDLYLNKISQENFELRERVFDLQYILDYIRNERLLDEEANNKLNEKVLPVKDKTLKRWLYHPSINQTPIFTQSPFPEQSPFK
jgi:hypothetical protein